MKKLLLALLAVPAIVFGQTYPSPTFSSLTLQNPLTAANGGTGTTTATGTGSAVLSNSPTLVTPNLGTPSAVTLTNGAGLPIATGVSGLGTGVAAGLANAATGSGAPVLGTSPTISSPTLNGTFAGSLTIPSTSLTYTASGTGAVSQTLASRFAQVAYIDSYGAVGNGTSDDSTPLTNAMASLGASGGIVFLDCTKNYAILSNVTIPANVLVQQCNGGNPKGEALYTSVPAHINLASTASITMSANSRIDAIIVQSGITIPVQTPSAYAGTAIKLATGDANDVHINALIVGFATCVDGTNGGDHQHWDIECDANPGSGVGAVIIGQSFDTSYFKIRNWPWGTQGYTPSPTLTRTGIGIQILAVANDDSRMELFDYGHATCIDTRTNGNVRYEHIWCDTNSTKGLDIFNNNNSTFDVVDMWTTPGIIFESTSNMSFGFIYCNSNGVASSTCITTGAGVGPNVQIANLHIGNSTSYGINLNSTSAHIAIGNAILTGINGGVAPYIVGPSGWTVDQVRIGKITATDLAAGGALFGGNTQALPSIPSAATLAPGVAYDHYLVTGTTTITNISGNWGDRRLILTFNGALTLTNNANIQLTAAANLTTGSGTTIELWYDQTGCACWREMWHH